MSVTKLTNDNIENIAWSKLTGALPALDGSALTGVSGGTTVMKAASDPANDTNPTDGVGTMYLNTTDGNMFICMDATTDQNEWNNVGPGTGGVAYVPPQYFGDRAFWMGGSHNVQGYSNSNPGNVSYQTITTLGNSTEWGSLSQGHGDGPGTLSNGTRALCAGGYNAGAMTQRIDYVTVASVGSTAVFGDITPSSNWRWFDGTSNGTRGIFSPPLYGSSSTPVQYVTVQTTGNSQTFGHITFNGSYYGNGSLACNGSKAVHFGGYHSHTKMGYVDIATTGDALLFGDLNGGRYMSSAMNDRTYGICYSGVNGGSVVQPNQYITIATNGTSLAFSQALGSSFGGGSCSNETRGLYHGTYGAGWETSQKPIEYVTINNPSQNAISFGNISSLRTSVHGTSGNP